MDDDISLPADTLHILNQFLAEKAAKEREEEELIKAQNHNVNIEENWQLSQFWYNEKTKSDLTKLTKSLIKSEDKRVALLSCPSLYKSMKEAHENVLIFEFDERFSVYGSDFVHYDINKASDANYLSEYQNQFDIIIADPPFLSEECIENISHIIKRISKDENSKIIFCSGEVVHPWLAQHLNLVKQKYKPEHERNLGNEFVTYANFNIQV